MEKFMMFDRFSKGSNGQSLESSTKNIQKNWNTIRNQRQREMTDMVIKQETSRMNETSAWRENKCDNLI